MKPKIYTHQEHHIRNHLIPSYVLSVLNTLREAGYEDNFLVGGAVRDLLLGQRPKDFDVSTSATPGEVKRLFRHALIVGRRFPLVHIRFGKEIVEVATFRAGDPATGDLITRDNVWGSPEEDAWRRDFTINGLFYDPLDHRIIDYVGGFEDLQKRTLRVIGDPILRFKQDPVRMIRMQKFRARFELHVDPLALEALAVCRHELMKSSPARVLEEILRMLESGASEGFFRLLTLSNLLSLLFPTLTEYFTDSPEIIYRYLQAADQMNQQGYQRALNRSVLTAALLFPIVQQKVLSFLSQKKHLKLGEVFSLIEGLIHELLTDAFSHFPKRIRHEAKFILQMQYRITPLEKGRHARPRLVQQKGFIHALTLLRLRAYIEHDLLKTYEQWKRHYQELRG